MFYQLKEAGVAGEELDFIEGDNFKAAAGGRFFGLQDGPQFTGIGGGDVFGRILVALRLLMQLRPLRVIGPWFETAIFLWP